MFWHPELKLFLVVYVDDFKLCGPADNLKAGWDLIRTDTAKSTAIKVCIIIAGAGVEKGPNRHIFLT